MEKNEILQELNDLDSHLAFLPRGMPFVVPEGYFDRMRMEALHVARTEDPPAGYFDQLPSAMLNAAKSADHTSTIPARQKGARIVIFPARHWAAAAILLMCIGVGAGLLYRSGHAQETSPLASLPSDAVHAYAQANLSGLDATLPDGTIASLGSPDLTGFSGEELEAYLAEAGWVE